MSKHILASGAALLLASTVAASAGGIGFGITIGPGAFGPSFRSAPPPREYRPRARSYREEPSSPRRQHRQNSDDDAKAEASAPAKTANEGSSIAVLSVRASEPDLHGENSSIAGGPRPAEPAPSPTVTVQLENSSIAAALRPAQASLPEPVAVQAESPVQQSASPQPLCSRYYPTAGRTVQAPCE